MGDAGGRAELVDVIREVRRRWRIKLAVRGAAIAIAGTVLALLVSKIHFSVSAAMGFISIFGIAIQDAILVVTYFQRLRDVEGLPLEQAAKEAAVKRFRAGLMTTLVATLGLTPAALSHGIGSETQKPLAIVVIGGSLILAILTRVLQPPMLVLAHRWFDRRKDRPPGSMPPPSMPPYEAPPTFDEDAAI